jgi:hypothetical protein
MKTPTEWLDTFWSERCSGPRQTGFALVGGAEISRIQDDARRDISEVLSRVKVLLEAFERGDALEGVPEKPSQD